MKNKRKLLLLIVLLLVLIGGANFAYKKLVTKNVPPQTNLTLPNAKDTTSKDNTEQDSKNNQDTSSTDETPTKIAATDIAVTDIDGNEVLLSSYYGKPIVLNFWASWCPPCKSEMPDFEDVYLEQGEEIQFLMINMTDGTRETLEKGSAYIEEQGFTFPVLYDTKQNAALTYGVTSLPTTYFIDKDGYVVAGQKGAMAKETLLQGIELLTTEDPSS